MDWIQEFEDAAGQTLYAYPAYNFMSNLERVACTEYASGRYRVTLDSAIDTRWLVFVGATTPTNPQQSIQTLNFDDTTELLARIDELETVLAKESSATANRDALLNSIADIEVDPNVQVTILPGSVVQSELQTGSRLRAYARQRSPIMASVYDATGTNPLDLTGKTLQFIVDYADQTNLLTIENADISTTGVDHNSFYFDPPEDLVAKSQLLNWSLRDTDGVLSSGELEILYAP